MKSFLLGLLVSLSALATPELTELHLTRDLAKRPPAFAVPEGLAIFADFTYAAYELTYDLNEKKAMVRATIAIQTAESGRPVFDSLQEPTSIVLDGREVTASLVSTPDRSTLVRVVNETIDPGAHLLEITVPLTHMVQFAENGVHAGLWMGDLEDRNYIEKYLPTNFVFDRVPMVLKLKFVGGADNQRLYTNGDVMKLRANEYVVDFQENYNITCPYLHITPVGSFTEREFSFRSIDGRNLPGVIYIPRDWANPEGTLLHLENETVRILNELEGDYGPFPHKSLTIYNNGPSGGMEYSGATITSLNALGHELFHSYFARAVLPADGNSGWIDEALARWRDRGYQRITSLVGSSKMANLGTYARLTDRNAYSFGERFMALLDGKLEAKGGLKPFLRYLVKERAYDPLTTEEFLRSLNAFYGVDFTAEFKQYLYGAEVSGTKNLKSIPVERDGHVHRQLSDEELAKFL